MHYQFYRELYGGHTMKLVVFVCAVIFCGAIVGCRSSDVDHLQIQHPTQIGSTLIIPKGLAITISEDSRTAWLSVDTSIVSDPNPPSPIPGKHWDCHCGDFHGDDGPITVIVGTEAKVFDLSDSLSAISDGCYWRDFGGLVVCKGICTSNSKDCKATLETGPDH